jgi:hypothetical protein
MDGVVRWRRIDRKAVISTRFGVANHGRCVGELLKTLGSSHIGARPRHPKPGERIVATFKRPRRGFEGASRRRAGKEAYRDLVPGRSSHRSEELQGQAMAATRSPSH